MFWFSSENISQCNVDTLVQVGWLYFSVQTLHTVQGSQALNTLNCALYSSRSGNRLIETLEKHAMYFGYLNPENSLEFCVKTLNPLEICERQKIDQHIYFSL